MNNEKAPTGIYDERMVRGLARAAQFNEQHGITNRDGELWDDECREALAMARKIGLAAPRPKPSAREAAFEIDAHVDRRPSGIDAPADLKRRTPEGRRDYIVNAAQVGAISSEAASVMLEAADQLDASAPIEDRLARDPTPRTYNINAYEFLAMVLRLGAKVERDEHREFVRLHTHRGAIIVRPGVDLKLGCFEEQ